jgi:hypothetical protein
MRTLLTATSYFPHAYYIAECLRSERIVVEACETYTKQSYRNHFEIAGPNGRQKLTVPVIKTEGNRTRTKDIRISYDLPWQNIHLRSLSTAYNKSPYLTYYIDPFLPIFEKRFDFLLDLNHLILWKVLETLQAGKEISITDGYEKTPSGAVDLRKELVVKQPLLRGVFPSYTQPFTERYGFLENLSVLDVIFCLGPAAKDYLENLLPSY